MKMKGEMQRKREEIAAEREKHHKMIQNMNGIYIYLYFNTLNFLCLFLTIS